MAASFSHTVESRFGRRADAYDSQAVLQRAVAWRLVRLLRGQALPAGSCADLGAGSGAVAAALAQLAPALLQRQPLQVDCSAALLARNPVVDRQRLWDLNRGLPPDLHGAALLTSSFALQWLDHPASQLGHWCDCLLPGGVLALAVPTAGSFRQWLQAAADSGIPCTALPLPAGPELVQAAGTRLQLLACQQLRFSRPAGGLALLRQMRAIGADASPAAPLSGVQLRHLLRHWPAGPTTWELLVLVGRRP
jgi:malonyl-CoA O-methyltransferase